MRIILNGAGGRMGTAFFEFCKKEEISVSRADVVGFMPLSDCDGDVIIDFSSPDAVKELTEFAVAKKMPTVIATTGHSEEEIAAIKRASAEIPIFFSSNLTRGAAFMLASVKRAAKVFENADVEIIETHHSEKADSPSGTALKIAEEISKVLPEAYPVFGRFGRRKNNEIGIHSVRRGNVVGEHEVFFSTCGETFCLKHTVHGREAFAKCAIEAARFIIGRPSGLYGIEEMLKEKYGEI